MEKTVVVNGVELTETQVRDAVKELEKPAMITGEEINFAHRAGDPHCKMSLNPAWTGSKNVLLRVYDGDHMKDPAICNRGDLLQLADMLKVAAMELPI